MEFSLEVPFSSEREAGIAYDALRVEKEPPRSCVSRDMRQDGCVLRIKFQAAEARNLRVSVNGFLEHLILVTDTILQFGPPLWNFLCNVIIIMFLQKNERRWSVNPGINFV